MVVCCQQPPRSHLLSFPTALTLSSCYCCFLPECFSLKPLGMLFPQFPQYWDAKKGGLFVLHCFLTCFNDLSRLIKILIKQSAEK